ncbi:hypothetical protein [Leekyejoonella antrihumi]|uniref:MOSC domain-containing protein n=1 Tax=Leekyejoonella antrihumi TaxID=1660198 RepID=A0A563E3B6_9MICO|nr:hypothetical protein [Leekyejoonella antrihumi]TWP36691.1 hypothetical protein FGL98_09575 [Leekyejoonella antrihumi]
MTMHVAHLSIYPDKGAPGVGLSTATVEPDGLTGDRRKKAAVHLVCLKDTADRDDPPRANIVLDAPDDLVSLVGARVTIGTALLEVTRQAGNCPGVYAEVIEPGQVSVGDEARRV